MSAVDIMNIKLIENVSVFTSYLCYDIEVNEMSEENVRLTYEELV